MSSSAEFAPPAAFGLPERFDSWRDMQVDAILKGIDSPQRFIMQAAPTGFGKSLVYMGHAMISDARTILLTSTKGLQNQLIADFAESGLVDIRGMNSYECVAGEDLTGLPKSTNCDTAPCHSGFKCPIKDSLCTYYNAFKTAKGGQLVVTNYTYWMTINKYGDGLGAFDLMICDEGHHMPDEVADFLAVELEQWEFESLTGKKLLQDGVDISDWVDWAKWHHQSTTGKYDQLSGQIKLMMEEGRGVKVSMLHEARRLRKLCGLLGQLTTLKGDWVYEFQGKRKERVRFDPIWPSQYAEAVLFKGVPKVVIFSATIRPKTADILGIAPGERDFNEYPSTFPASRRPVYHVPTVQLNHRTTDGDMRIWLSRIDNIIRQRQDRKGILHTVSYARRNLVMQNSEFSHLMISHDSDNTREVVAKFKAMPAPAILVSPSVSTGWDFPYDACHYQIIGKLPFPDTRGQVVKARMESDKDYANYVCMQTLVQMAGRGMRAEDDICETLIIDDNIGWFLWRNKQFAPKWFMDAFKKVNAVPTPIKLVK